MPNKTTTPERLEMFSEAVLPSSSRLWWLDLKHPRGSEGTPPLGPLTRLRVSDFLLAIIWVNLITF